MDLGKNIEHLGLTFIDIMNILINSGVCVFTKLLIAILQPKFASLYPLLFPEV